MTSAAGTTALPPTEMENDFEPPLFTPSDIPYTTIATETQSWYSRAIAPPKTNGPKIEPWGTPVPLPRWTEIDNSEIIIARMLRPAGLNPSLSTPTEQPSQGTSSEHSVHSSSPPMPTGLVMLSLSPSASPAHWKKGNWSACSTSCGLGAIWRSVSCSTGDGSDCDLATRPVPARRCYLRPCSAWKIGEWSKCSKNCGVGVKVREIQCYDTRDQRLLRPFHCQAISPRPPVRIPCNIHNCLEWYTSSWGQCSELCGGGEPPETKQAGLREPPTYPQWDSEVERRDPTRKAKCPGVGSECADTYLAPQLGRVRVRRHRVLEPGSAARWRNRDGSVEAVSRTLPSSPSWDPEK
ncbi:A disintegrin and metalloproteinase with thrombospondin motifs 12-like [Sinocyclocheilus grahami]|uniref:A disintegrin and metalloproteinase with thrombospondin motifs 12-like n=1 Tax=Sinocyclocheilus grahami TaxID=75366 RepID=UPI0007AC8681|nr:PREDICTED: A disintegrin and metalloproteinase with thrombospondin motifs 12-like [Sinocyclocheilus grahami]